MIGKLIRIVNFETRNSEAEDTNKFQAPNLKDIRRPKQYHGACVIRPLFVSLHIGKSEPGSVPLRFVWYLRFETCLYLDLGI